MIPSKHPGVECVNAIVGEIEPEQLGQLDKVVWLQLAYPAKCSLYMRTNGVPHYSTLTPPNLVGFVGLNKLEQLSKTEGIVLLSDERLFTYKLDINEFFALSKLSSVRK